MLYWNANFQIPNSGAQAADVYVVASEENDRIKATFYSDSILSNVLFIKEYDMPEDVEDFYSYLLSLDEYQNYTKVD